MTLEPGVLMQARYTRMQLPPSAENGPDIDVDAATLTIAYLFKEDWWQAGFVAGGGGYFLNPKDPGRRAGRDRSRRVRLRPDRRTADRLHGESQDRHPAGGRRAPPPGVEQPEAGHRLCCRRLEVLTGMAGFPPDLWGRAGSAAVGFFLVGLM